MSRGRIVLKNNKTKKKKGRVCKPCARVTGVSRINQELSKLYVSLETFEAIEGRIDSSVYLS